MAVDVATRMWRDVISSKEDLHALLGEPSERAVKKEMASLDEHCRNFIERSPFLLMGTSNTSGQCDVSPKGDKAGFVLVLDDQTIAIPDRPGNKRADGFKNIVVNPHVGLLFIVPGKEETLRVNGRATLVRDGDLLDRMAVDGKRPVLATVIEVEECFLHCAKAFHRSLLWDTKTWPDRAELPSLSRMLIDQVKMDVTLEELEAQIATGMKNLY